MDSIDLSKKNLIYKFLDGLFLNILLRLKGIIYLPILINFFSKSDIGMISLWQSTASLLAGLYLLSIPDSSNRVILEYKKDNNTPKIIETISTIFTFSFAMYFIVSIILSIVYFSFFNNQKDRFFEILLLLLFSNIINKLAIFVFQIFQQSKVIIKTQLIIEYGSLLIVIFGIYFMQIENIQYVIFTYIFVSLSVGVFLFIRLHSIYAYGFLLKFDILKNLLKISIFLLPNMYALAIIQSSDFLFIKYYWTLTEVGEYSFAYSIGSIISGLSMAVTFFWYSSVVYADDNLRSKMVDKINFYMPILFFCVALVFYLISAPLINLINSDYIGVNNIIQILIVGFFINIFVQILSGILYARGKEKLILASTIAGALINLFLNFLWIPKYGLYGAALATTLAYMIIFMIQYRSVRVFLPMLKSRKNNLNFIILLLMAFMYILINLREGI